MKKEFEYYTLTIELNDYAPILIKDELEKMGRDGFMVVGTSHWGGFKSPKKVMYTLMRPKQPYRPDSEKPNFNSTVKSKVNDLAVNPEEFEEWMKNLWKSGDDFQRPSSQDNEPQ